MNRIEDVLQMKNLAEGAKEEIKDAKQAVADLKALASVATSEGGTQLQEMLKEDCRDILVHMINAKKSAEVGWQDIVLTLLSDFEAKFTLFNTIKSAPHDYEYADQALEERLEEILEG